MLQLVYTSAARAPMSDAEIESLLAVSQANNARDEITGLLYTDGCRFLQALEGPKTIVEDTFLRIVTDPRHHELLLLCRRSIVRREFGEWSMARRSFDEPYQQFLKRIGELCRNADASVRDAFARMVGDRDAAE